MSLDDKSDCVAPFLAKAAHDYARYEHQEMLGRLDDLVRYGHFGKSPLEKLFGIAMCVQWCASELVGARVAEIAETTWQWAATFGDIDDGTEGVLLVRPQYKIGRYRADFVIEVEKHHPEKIEDGWRIDKWVDKKAVVELDGTAFHERDETERRREKKRDRFMQRMGFDVLRYTGKEIMQDPYRIAADVIDHLSGEEEECKPLPEYLDRLNG